MTVLNRGDIAGASDAVGFVGGVFKAFGYLNVAERRWAWVLLLSTVVNAVLGLVGIAGVLPFFQLMVAPDPLSSKQLLGRVFASIGVGSTSEAIAIAGVMLVGLIGLKNAYGILHARLVNRFCSRVETRMATDVLERIVYAPFSWFLTQNASVLRDVVTTHVIEWSRGILRPALNLANNGFLLLTALSLVVPMTPGPALLIGLFIVSIGGGFIAMSRPRLRLASDRKKRSGLLAGVAATEAVGGGRDVRMSPAGQLLIDEFRKEYSIYAYSDADSRQWQLVPRLGIEVIGVSALVAIALAALASGIDRVAAASILALYALVAVRLLPIIGEVASSISSIQSSLPQLTHIRMLRDELPARDASDAGATSFRGWNAIELDDVSYRYPNSDRLALENVTLTLERGRSYGLVGASGAGKSTVADIVASLLIPTSGQFRIDGVVVAEAATQASWRRRVSYVAQQPVIFDATIADNIALGVPLAPVRDGRLAEAIAAAGLSSLVESLERKEQTQIGDRGTRLSGGQRQRVAIARAIFQQADVLILDEATSALDSLTERELADAFDAFKGKMTVLAIAHRFSTVMRCDEIFVLDRGRLIAQGHHSELMLTSDRYRRFVEAQSLGADFV
jgi:ABC-type multidrug transport system fused ATPase/permease subunit